MEALLDHDIVLLVIDLSEAIIEKHPKVRSNNQKFCPQENQMKRIILC